MQIKKRNKKGLYTVDGTQYPSVTTIIRTMGVAQELLFWYGKHGYAEAQRLTEVHSNYGKAMHKACDETIFKGHDTSLLDTEFRDRIVAVAEWIKQQNYTPVSGEQTVYNPDLQYAGTADGILKSSDSVIVIDFKTGREHRFEEVLQLSAYANCPMVQANEAYIIRLGKESTDVPSYTRYIKEDLDKGFEMFKKMLELYHYKKEISKRRIKHEQPQGNNSRDGEVS